MTTHAASARARALGLFATMLVVPVTAWGEDRGEPASVGLVVEVGFDGPDAAPLRGAIDEHVRARLDVLGHHVSLGEPTELRVAIDWQDEAEVVYAVIVTVQHEGEEVARVSETCPQCGTPELFDRIAACVDGVTDELEALPEEATTTPAVAVEPTPSEALPADRPQPRPRLSVVGWLGVAAAGTGAVLGAVGAGVWAKGEESEVNPTNETLLIVTDYRPPGITLVATGGVVLLGGLAMLVTDLARGRRRGPRVTATIDPRGTAAAIIEGRF